MLLIDYLNNILSRCTELSARIKAEGQNLHKCERLLEIWRHFFKQLQELGGELYADM